MSASNEPEEGEYSGAGLDFGIAQYTDGEMDGKFRLRFETEEHLVRMYISREDVWEMIEAMGKSLKADDITTLARMSRRSGR